MTELLPRDINDKPVGFVDDEGDIHPVDDYSEELDTTATEDILIEDLPYPERRERASTTCPESVKANKSRIRIANIGHRAAGELTPHEELGGGIRQHNDDTHYRPLDEVIVGTEEWQTEIYDAVERFGMNELDTDMYDAMSSTQKEAFSLHFERYFSLMKGHRNFIESRDGVVAHHPELEERYGKDRSQAELLAYSQRLRDLMGLLEETGIPQKVREYLYELRRQRKRSGYRKIVEHRDYQITFKEVNGIKKAYRKSS